MEGFLLEVVGSSISRATVPKSKAAKKIHREVKKKKRATAEKRSSSGKRTTPVKKMPRKPVKTEETAAVEAPDPQSTWKKRRGTKAKARPSKRQRTEEKGEDPLPVRPAVTLLPRLHQTYEAPTEDEVKPSDSVSQIGEGSYVAEGFNREERDQERGP